MKIKTQEDFINKSNEVHNFKYDYSQVNYIKSSEKVEIVCREHGSFFMTPNHHLRGDGCKICQKLERFNKKLCEFKEKADEIHNKKYDYSFAVYKGVHEKLEIICPIHGSFWQTPHSHIVLKHNCPVCGHAAAGLKRVGNTNSSTDAAREKTRDTCMRKYGAPTWAESEEGREKLREIVTSEEVAQKMVDTCMERYGAPIFSMSEAGKAKQRVLMNTSEMKAKIKDGYNRKYGSHYMQTEEGRKKAYTYMHEKHKIKMKQAFFDKYGVKGAGAVPEFQQKMWATKRRNGTFNTSRPEETLYLLLCDKYSKDNVFRQYSKDPRYPFHCDFYIKSIDTFVELNAHWSHNDHWYNSTNSKDVETANKWLTCGTPYYKSAYDVWTCRDILKRDTAIKNNINYVVFWNSDLSDAREWLFNS